MEPTAPQQPQKEGSLATPPKAVLHTYQDDLAKAMDATDATVVQSLITEARVREEQQKDEVVRKRQKGWYTLGALFLALGALIASGYGLYHYRTLTVPVQESFSVGVFQQTAPFVIEGTDIRETVATLAQDTTLPEGKPVLVQLVSNTPTPGTELSKEGLFSFFEAKASEPFLASFGVIRYGVVNTGKAVIPFVIGSVTDSEVSAKELLIAEPDMLRMFYKPLNIPIAKYTEDIGKTFTQQYVYNLPTRGMVVTGDEGQTVPLFYGYATEKLVVFSTDYSVLKTVYDSILSQQ